MAKRRPPSIETVIIVSMAMTERGKVRRLNATRTAATATALTTAALASLTKSSNEAYRHQPE
jgi:hypothetical protein